MYLGLEAQKQESVSNCASQLVQYGCLERVHMAAPVPLPGFTCSIMPCHRLCWMLQSCSHAVEALSQLHSGCQPDQCELSLASTRQGPDARLSDAALLHQMHELRHVMKSCSSFAGAWLLLPCQLFANSRCIMVAILFQMD